MARYPDLVDPNYAWIPQRGNARSTHICQVFETASLRAQLFFLYAFQPDEPRHSKERQADAYELRTAFETTPPRNQHE